MFAKTLLAAAACAVFFAASAQSAADGSHVPQAGADATAAESQISEAEATLPKEDSKAGESAKDGKPGSANVAYERTVGRFRLRFACDKAEDLAGWTTNVFAPAICEWTPKLAAMFATDGWSAPEQVDFEFRPDSEMDGTPAWAAGSTVSLNREWFRKNLGGEALGATIHELAHVMQAYWWDCDSALPEANEDNCPSWASEGLADYVRWFLFEPQAGGCDSLVAEPPEKFHYNDSYRTTASFFDFVERSHPGTLKKLNAALRTCTFDDGKFWKEATGKTPLELEAGWKAELSGKRAK